MNKESLIRKIKEKKELSGLSSKIVEEELNKEIKGIDISVISEKESKVIMKSVREKLRKLTGRFQYTSKKENILDAHASTKERKEDYPFLKSMLKDLNVQSILDLGCGLNPLALADSSMTYYAVDIKEDELKIIHDYFKLNNIKGKAFFYDVRKIKDDLPKTDITLILKLFDVLETKGHKLAETMINNIHSKFILISFSTKTLSGKPMNHPQRGWIEHLLARLNYEFKTFTTKNEIFYLAEKL
ncbi:hypothetical protein KW805_03115 [Candidatus Pacearchaeota archaeon]|nr:hypothetical protein [Candidatus Pacearchaeota archaeon]